MKISFEKLGLSIDELKKFDRTNPYNVAALFINIICDYSNADKFNEKLQYLMGDFQPISNLMKSQIKDRMMQNNKYEFIGKSYFKGANPENDYTPSEPYEVEFFENDYSREEEGFVKLWVNSGGADNARFITVRLAKDGNYYVWGDSFMGLLADIRKKESENPWA